MTADKLRRGLARLEVGAAKREGPRPVYLWGLLPYTGKVRQVRQSGEEKKARKAHALRLRLGVLARRGEV